MRSVIATEVIPNIMHARQGGRVLSAQHRFGWILGTTTPAPVGAVPLRASVKSTSAGFQHAPTNTRS